MIFQFLSSERISFSSVQEQAWIFVLHEFNKNLFINKFR